MRFINFKNCFNKSSAKTVFVYCNNLLYMGILKKIKGKASILKKPTPAVRFMEKTISRTGHKNFVLLCALLIGAISGFAAIALKKFAENIHAFTGALDANGIGGLLLWSLPLLGIIAALLAQKIIFRNAAYEKSLSSLIYILERNLPDIPFRKTFSHLITSGLSIGLGGSAGLEAPIVITGAAIGSNSAASLGLNKKDKTLLLACGAAAGISAIFNSPVAGVLFVAEVLLTEFSVASLIPILIASASAAVVSRIFYKNQIFLPLTQEWAFDALLFYILLGLASAVIGTYMIKSTYAVSSFLAKYLKNIWLKAAIGGSLLALLIFLFPPLFGEGYSSINALFNGNYHAITANTPLAHMFSSAGTVQILIFCAFIILIKSIATALTIDCGGDGGIFASAIFSGAFTGFVFATLMNMTGLVTLHIPNFIAAGMCGVFTSVLRAPMTGIFLIAEITGGYLLFIPLMLVSAVAFFISKYFEPYSVYTKGLAEKNLFNEDKDSLILSRISINSLIEADYVTLKASDSFHKVLEAMTASSRNIFPVLDSDGKLEGIVHVDNIRKYLLEKELHDVLLIYDAMDAPAGELTQDDNLSKAMTNFEVFNTWQLPVLSSDTRKYMGFISKSNILSNYRELVKDFS